MRAQLLPSAQGAGRVREGKQGETSLGQRAEPNSLGSGVSSRANKFHRWAEQGGGGPLEGRHLG